MDCLEREREREGGGEMSEREISPQIFGGICVLFSCKCVYVCVGEQQSAKGRGMYVRVCVFVCVCASTFDDVW